MEKVVTPLCPVHLRVVLSCVFFLTFLPASCASFPRIHAASEAVIYHISNESGLIGCIPETAVMQYSAC